jgi:serine/threonine protein kinase
VGEVLAGRYQLIRPLGEGGMGVVYLAVQTDGVRRSVAVKLIRAGRETPHIIARFEAERQALALMTHPHIARVFDGGVTTDNRPFFVMEYVDGRPVTEYCHARRLSIRERLTLFLSVCDAVRHAHQRGVIHRDLKPSNVLVAETDGVAVPKVIDFGLAKATGTRLTDQMLSTAPGALIGTPVYMSPEQAGPTADDVDTRTDVYALGVLLYELLTGTTPIPAEVARSTPLHELLRKIQEEEPEPPSRRVVRHSGGTAPQGDPTVLSRKLSQELDWIVLRTIAKERDRRYDSPAALSDDLRRYLADQPVAAGPPTRWYRFRKFIRRNRVAVIVAILILALCGTAIGGLLRMQQLGIEVAAAREMSENMGRSREWFQLGARIDQIQTWLTDSPNSLPAGGRDRVQLNLHDRDRLRRAMLDEVLAEVEKAEQLPLSSELSIALLIEAGVRQTVAYCHADIDRPAQGIPHCERSVAILNYLASPASGLSDMAEVLAPRTAATARVRLLDLRERAGAIERMETELAETEQLLAVQGMRFPQGALAGIRGAFLGRRGDFAAGEKLLLARHAALTQADNHGMEFLPGERVATIRRLVNLYTAWHRPDEAAKWAGQLPREFAPGVNRPEKKDQSRAW